MAAPDDSPVLLDILRRWGQALDIPKDVLGGVSSVLEASALVAGYMLGGKVGVATLVYVVAIGPVVEASFALAERSPFTL